MLTTTVYAKNAFNPSPGASANGSFAQNAIISVATQADNAVAVNRALLSIPVTLKIPGCTARIYAIVINVVRPAIISTLTLVPFLFS